MTWRWSSANLLPSIVLRAFRRTGQQHKIGANFISLPGGHHLPEDQTAHRLYDCFLEILSRELDGDRWIVDVGANVGDTATVIAQSCRNPILCIEADEAYFKFLRRNVAEVASTTGRNIRCVEALVGTG